MPTFILKSLQTQEKFCYGITVVRGKSKVMDKKNENTNIQQWNQVPY